MCKFIWFITARNLLQAGLVAEVLEVLVVLGDAAGAQELDNPGIRERVEVAAEHQLYVPRFGTGTVRRPQRLGRLVQYRLQFVAEHHRLNQLYIAEFRIPVDMCRANQNWLLYYRSILWS